MELLFRRQPEDIMNAQALAAYYHHAGMSEETREVIVAAAQRAEAPEWFIRKAAYQLMGEGKMSEAVEALLHEEPRS